MKSEENIDSQVKELERTGNAGIRENRFAEMNIEIGKKKETRVISVWLALFPPGI